MKKLSAFAFSALLIAGLTNCDSLEDTSLVRTEPLSIINGDTLLVDMYMTGLYKFRYEFSLSNGQRKIPKLFVAEFEDKNGNEAQLEIEQSANLVRVIMDKPVTGYSVPAPDTGVRYELQGTK